ncbi:mannosyltransferase [Sorochytrium milnesiophthora]
MEAALHIALRLLGALASPIQDCDETFNYLEPLHFVVHGSGAKTWEYASPYAIRTYMYTVLHAALLYTMRPFVLLVLHFAPTHYTAGGQLKIVEFYALRCALALMSFASETALIRAVQTRWDTTSKRYSRVVRWFLLLSPGMFHAAPAMLPSSFVMYTSTYALAMVLRASGTSATAYPFVRIALLFALGVLYGWPFAGALAVPWGLHQLFSKRTSLRLWRARLLRTFGGVAVLSAPMYVVDYMFYKRWLFVPVRIVLYNVSALAALVAAVQRTLGLDAATSEPRGPELYGTEPWHYYLINGALNFGAAWPLAFIGVCAMLLMRAKRMQSTVAVSGPLLLWLAVFMSQAHKEERFLYPVYPLVCVSAAVGLLDVVEPLAGWVILGVTGRSLRYGSLASITVRRLVMLVFAVLSVSRIAALVFFYSAPLHLYAWLAQHRASTSHHAPTTVCVGKEWHRFPNSFFLPDGVRLAWVKSHYVGLLPGFYTAPVGQGVLAASAVAHLDMYRMNDMNREETDRYVSLDQCDYLVDTELMSHRTDRVEPNYGNDKQFRRLHCVPFIDAGATRSPVRAFWIPELGSMRRVWGGYCAYERAGSSL